MKFTKILLGDKDYFELIRGMRITKKDIFKNQGDIPVISGHKKGDSYLGHISKQWLVNHNIPIYTKKLITLNSNGNVGGVFLRQLPKYTFHDDVTGIKIRNKTLIYEYIIYAIKNALVGKDFSWTHKLYQKNIEKVSIIVPVDKNGTPDTTCQVKLAAKYCAVEKYKDGLYLKYAEFLGLKVDLLTGFEYTEISLSDQNYFDVDNGERIRKVDINKADGTIPVYSGSKYKEDAFGFVSDKIKEVVPKARKFDGTFLTVNADGSVGKVFLRTGKFYANDIVNLIKIKKKEIVVEYLQHALEKEILLEGYNSWTNKLYKRKLKAINVKIPIKKDGNFDIEKQKEIAQKYEQIDRIKRNLATTVDPILTCNISVE